MSNGTLSASDDNHPLIQTLKEKIKIFPYLGVSFTEISKSRVRLTADLSESTSHKGTAFGGSLYSIAVLAAYALALQGLRARGIATENIVIQKGEIQYLKPVEEDFEVTASFETPEKEEEFFQALVDKKRTRGAIDVEVRVQGDLKATLHGVFVVRL